MEEKRKKDLVAKLREAFDLIDQDDSGMVDLAEMQAAPEKVQTLLGDIVGDGAELKNIFQMVDFDNSGAISIEEFCEGLVKLQAGIPVELYCVMKMCIDIKSQ